MTAEPKGWDSIVDNPDGSRTFTQFPGPHYPKGFELTIPKEAVEEALMRSNGTWPGSQPARHPLDEATDLAVGMVGVWWFLVLVLVVFFSIAELFS